MRVICRIEVPEDDSLVYPGYISPLDSYCGLVPDAGTSRYFASATLVDSRLLGFEVLFSKQDSEQKDLIAGSKNDRWIRSCGDKHREKWRFSEIYSWYGEGGEESGRSGQSDSDKAEKIRTKSWKTLILRTVQ